jgi:hypothetical protein
VTAGIILLKILEVKDAINLSHVFAEKTEHVKFIKKAGNVELSKP